jgi:hypothetical protein
MSKEGKTKNITARIKLETRRQKDKQKWRKVDVKPVGNTRIRRISRHR